MGTNPIDRASYPVKKGSLMQDLVELIMVIIVLLICFLLVLQYRRKIRDLKL